MRKAYFVFCLFAVSIIVPAFAIAQNKKAMPHFWSIPWGISMQQAEAIFAERDFTSSRDGNALITFARYEREEAMIILSFNRVGRFYAANVIYPGSPNTAIEKYNHYRALLFRRYGFPDKAVEYYNGNFARGDGREIEAITSENAFFFTEWLFEDNCLASVSILQSLDLNLSFRNPTFADAAR
jgi:hypothetical protein